MLLKRSSLFSFQILYEIFYEWYVNLYSALTSIRISSYVISGMFEICYFSSAFFLMFEGLKYNKKNKMGKM